MSYSRDGRGYTKPLPGCRINRGHPLAPDVLCCLFNEANGSTVYDLVANRLGTVRQVASAPVCTWASNGSGTALRSTTTNNNAVNFGTDQFMPTTEGTIVLGYRKTDTTNRTCEALSAATAASGSNRINIHLPYSDGVVYWDFGNSNAADGRVSIGGLTFGNDIWVFNAGSRGMEIWQNGLLRVSQTQHNTFTPGTHEFCFGGIYDAGAFSQSDLADFNFCHIFSKQLSQQQCRDISAAPFAGLLFPQIRRMKSFISPFVLAAGSNTNSVIGGVQ